MPPEPHAEFAAPCWHWPDVSQQPLGQFAAVQETPPQLPAVQSCDEPQLTQAPPPTPQA